MHEDKQCCVWFGGHNEPIERHQRRSDEGCGCAKYCSDGRAASRGERWRNSICPSIHVRRLHYSVNWGYHMHKDKQCGVWDWGYSDDRKLRSSGKPYIHRNTCGTYGSGGHKYNANCNYGICSRSGVIKQSVNGRICFGWSVSKAIKIRSRPPIRYV